MKRYGLVVSLTLLFAAFMWSCQQQDPAPLSPEGSITLGKKGGKPPAATYTIEVFFDKNTDPAVEEFTPVAERLEAGATFGGTGVGDSKDKTTGLHLTDFMPYFLASGECFDKLDGQTTFYGTLSVLERDDPFDAVGSFSTDDKVDLRISMWGVIESGPGGAGVWLLPTPENAEPLVVTSKTEPIPDPPPGGPDRLGIRVETGKGKNKVVCLEGIESQPWRIVITLN